MFSSSSASELLRMKFVVKGQPWQLQFARSGRDQDGIAICFDKPAFTAHNNFAWALDLGLTMQKLNAQACGRLLQAAAQCVDNAILAFLTRAGSIAGEAQPVTPNSAMRLAMSRASALARMVFVGMQP